MNFLNKHLGTDFENRTLNIISEYFNKPFCSQKALAIGLPSKQHKFDFVSYDNKIVVECKCYSFTSSGNVPSAKISVLNEAVFYLSFLPEAVQKYLAIKKSFRNKNQETLAEYYLRLNSHLLGDIKILEIDIEKSILRVLN